jgi:hypothetical protein
MIRRLATLSRWGWSGLHALRSNFSLFRLEVKASGVPLDKVYCDWSMTCGFASSCRRRMEEEVVTAGPRLLTCYCRTFEIGLESAVS